MNNLRSKGLQAAVFILLGLTVCGSAQGAVAVASCTQSLLLNATTSSGNDRFDQTIACGGFGLSGSVSSEFRTPPNAQSDASGSIDADLDSSASFLTLDVTSVIAGTVIVDEGFFGGAGGFGSVDLRFFVDSDTPYTLEGTLTGTGHIVLTQLGGSFP